MISSLPLASAMKPRSANFGAVRILPEKVSVPAKVASVPVVGRVTLVAPVVVRVRELAPEVMKAPAKVRVLPCTEVKLANVSIAASIVVSEVASRTSRPFNVPVLVKVKVSVFTTPVVVKLSAPILIAPKLVVMLPASKAPVPMMAVATASSVSTKAASLPSSLSSSAEDIVATLVNILFAPIFIALSISVAEASMASTIPEVIPPVLVIKIALSTIVEPVPEVSALFKRSIDSVLTSVVWVETALVNVNNL